MSVQSLLQEREQLRTKIEAEIASEETAIQEHRGRIQELRGLLPAKREPNKPIGRPKSPKASRSNGVGTYISEEVLMMVGTAIWENRDQLGPVWTPRQVRDLMEGVNMDKVRKTLERLRAVEWVRLDKPANGPHSSEWALYPGATLEGLETIRHIGAGNAS